MANLTIKVDDETLRRARIRALEPGTSVNALLAEYLAQYAGPDVQRAAIRRFLDLTKDWTGGSGPGGRTWKRSDLY
jgi:plasmid stability protein